MFTCVIVCVKYLDKSCELTLQERFACIGLVMQQITPIFWFAQATVCSRTTLLRLSYAPQCSNLSISCRNHSFLEAS